MKSILYYSSHLRLLSFTLVMASLSLGLSLGLTSFQTSTKAASAQNREVFLVDATAASGQVISLSLRLKSQGDENTIRFSLIYDPAIFSFNLVAPGFDLPPGSQIITDPNQASGQVGITIALPIGQTFTAGTRQVANISFTVKENQPVGASPITFGDTPIARSITDVNGAALPATFTGGTINVINPAPKLVSMDPTSATAGGPTFTITVTGLNFVNDSVVWWNGNPRNTDFVSTTRLTARIQAEDIASAGTATVSVFNTSPGGGVSSGLTFTINAGAPTIAGVSPNLAPVGSPDVTITVNGMDFTSASKVRFDSAELNTSFISATQLTAVIPASSLTTVGTANITVVNPPPGGGTSNAVTFSIVQPSPLPTITSLNPAFAVAGGPQFTLTVNGTGFASNSVVQWNGSNRQTSFGSATQLTATIPATDIAAQGTANVTVFTPAPGGGTSNTVQFFIGAQLLTSVSAASYMGNELADASIIAGFGIDLATQTRTATSQPLPTTMGGTTIKIRDSAGTERFAPLFFVSPFQVNYQSPPGMADGLATVISTSGDNKIAVGSLQVTRVAPGIFSANSDGRGVAAAFILRVKPDNSQVNEPILRFDSAQARFVSAPYDLGSDADQLFLVLFGTGYRYRSSMAVVSATIGGTNAQVTYADVAPGFTGLDQANIRIPRSMIGRGEVDVVLTVNGKVANTVTLNFK